MAAAFCGAPTPWLVRVLAFRGLERVQVASRSARTSHPLVRGDPARHGRCCEGGANHAASVSSTSPRSRRAVYAHRQRCQSREACDVSHWPGPHLAAGPESVQKAKMKMTKAPRTPPARAPEPKERARRSAAALRATPRTGRAPLAGHDARREPPDVGVKQASEGDGRAEGGA
ncbi:unnamed protein product [Prorocentrum cordatum]|uniref:Uncharacterized protein n=1 Tax=Prorocentrum cordatum TaxID=2364126 RepID=A0ABN9UQU4_9DINO|nr:unnamed protein product [Polarella glacialis]